MSIPRFVFPTLSACAAAIGSLMIYLHVAWVSIPYFILCGFWLCFCIMAWDDM